MPPLAPSELWTPREKKLQAGDALFIPEGFWHQVDSTGVASSLPSDPFALVHVHICGKQIFYCKQNKLGSRHCTVALLAYAYLRWRTGALSVGKLVGWLSAYQLGSIFCLSRTCTPLKLATPSISGQQDK